MLRRGKVLGGAVLGAAALTAALLAYPAQAAVQTTVYVSPSGSDANPGTSAGQPVRTLQHARDLVRGLDQSMTGAIVVSLAAGTNPRTKPRARAPRGPGGHGH